MSKPSLLVDRTRLSHAIATLTAPQSGFSFVLAIWLLSRAVIGVAVLLAGSSPTAHANGVIATGWHLFTHWDGKFYERIATLGYEYSTEQKEYSIAFFPMFPLLAWGLMQLGLPFAVSGTLVNNLAFLLALWVLYGWLEKRYTPTVARWSTVVLAWCPFSLFTAVAYTEGVFLLFSTAALRAFDRQHYAWTALWGACATATRPTGIALIPAFLLTAIRERRPLTAYLGAIASGLGLGLFSLYCYLRFGDGLAFLHAQKAWRPNTGFALDGWLKIVTQVTLGTVDWSKGVLKTPWHPVLIALILVLAYTVWCNRQRLGSPRTGYAGCLLVLGLWLVAGDPLINAVMIGGSGYLIWWLRNQLSSVVVNYGFCGLALILASGSTISLGRIAYGIVSLAIALGVLLADHRLRWRYATVGFFTILLVSFSVRFAQLLWAG